jgi:micrococcal nuclease
MKKKNILLIFLLIASGVFYYTLTEENITLKTAYIERVVDGDTLETDSGIKIRLKGINTPEKEEDYYEEAKEFLKNLALEKTIQYEDYGTDKYGRTLGHIFIGKNLLNSEIVKEGLAYSYYYEKDSHFDEILAAEKIARESELNLWKKSTNSNCLELIELRYVEAGERCTNGELLKIKNSCSIEFDVTIKDDATHIYQEKIEPNQVFSKTFSCIWNDNGDSLYVREDNGLLIFYRY